MNQIEIFFSILQRKVLTPNDFPSLDAGRVDLRVDHQLSSKHLIFGHYDWFENLNAMPLVYNNPASPVESPNRIPGTNWMINHTWTVSPASIFEHHFSVAESQVNRSPRHLGFDVTSLGFPKYIPESQRAAQFPQVSIGGLSLLGSTGTTYSAVVSTTTQYAAPLTLLRGRHTLKSGVDLRLYHTTMDRPSPVGISAGGSFTGGPNPQAASAPSGRGLADLLLGTAGVSVLIRPVWDYQHPYYAAYTQDEIKLTARLTLTLGLRYSLEKPWTSVDDIMVFLDRFSPSPLAGQVPGFPDLRGGLGFTGAEGRGWRTQITDTDNFDPRIDIGYAGNAGVALPTSVNYNQLPMQQLSLGTALNQLVPNPFYGVITDPTSTLSRTQVQRGQLLRPYPHFLNMYETQVPVGHSVYHALQLKLERRSSQGLAVLLAYTHSKIIDNVSEFSGSMGFATNPNNNYCYPCDRSLSYQQVPDVLRLSYRYELPLGLGKPYVNRGALAPLIGGWSVAGFISADYGTPVSVLSPNDSNSFGGGESMRPNATGQRARLDGGPKYADGALYYNPAAFARTPQFAFGNVTRALPDVRIPGNVN